MLKRKKPHQSAGLSQETIVALYLFNSITRHNTLIKRFSHHSPLKRYQFSVVDET